LECRRAARSCAAPGIMQGGRCLRRNAGWLASSVVRGAPEGRHHAAAAVRGPPCRERAPAGRLDQEAATGRPVALAVRQTPAPRRPVRGHRAVTPSIGPPRARPPPAARRGARRVPADQALARPRASPPQRCRPPCVSRLAHAASAPHVRGNRGPGAAPQVLLLLPHQIWIEFLSLIMSNFLIISGNH
jgi:hypothetical protein